MVRSEKLIELGNSWFSPKCIEVQPQVFRLGGRALDGCGGLGSYQIQLNSEYRDVKPGSETTGDKVRGRKGNSPDRRLRSQRHAKCGKDVEMPKQPGGWLRSSHPLKSA